MKLRNTIASTLSVQQTLDELQKLCDRIMDEAKWSESRLDCMNRLYANIPEEKTPKAKNNQQLL